MRTIGFVTVLTMMLCGQFVFILNNTQTTKSKSPKMMNEVGFEYSPSNDILKNTNNMVQKNNREIAKMWYVGQDMALLQIQNNQ